MMKHLSIQSQSKINLAFFISSKVSLISRVVPSPDWFIGVDSFDLCVEGKWVESVVLDVRAVFFDCKVPVFCVFLFL